MLEQAVYARRNHTAILAAVFLLLLSGSAQAADVLRVDMDTRIEHLLASPDGGAWTSTYAYRSPALQRIAPDGTVRTAADDTWAAGVALGPDGNAWFNLVGDALARVDAAGTMTPFPANRLGAAMATGPDGTLWTTTLDRRQLLRVAPDGTATPMPLDLPDCDGEGWPSEIARAADGAMWFYVVACGFVRLPPGGVPAVIAFPRAISVEQLEPDATGGVWFSSDLEPGGGHVDPSGRVTLLRGVKRAHDVDLAPDGSAWFATGSCVLVRAQTDGNVTRSRIAIPARQLDFDPAGGLWLASFTRLQRTTPGAPAGRCDDRPPRVRIVPDPAKPISLAQLRRLGGFRITVREPFSIEGYVFDTEADETIAGVDRTVTARAGRTLRVRMSERVLRRIARHRGEPLGLIADVRDREGNYTGVEYQLRFRR